jgi:hypothetical protein
VQQRATASKADNAKRGLLALETAAAQGAQIVAFAELAFEPRLSCNPEALLVSKIVVGWIFIDQQGVIRAKLFHEGYRQRHSTDELIEAAKAVK